MNQDINDVVLKTGTLTIGIICKDGIVVGADNRMSYGAQGGGVSYLAGKAKKIIEINDRIIVTTAGTASDAKKLSQILGAELKLKELKTKERVSIKEAASLLSNIQYQSIRQFSAIPPIAHFILAGYDDLGSHLYDASPDGYLQEIKDYAASGAGFIQAHPILDSEYKKDMSLEEAKRLVIKCLKASMGREPSVGDGIDLYTVKDGEIKEILKQEVKREFVDIDFK